MVVAVAVLRDVGTGRQLLAAQRARPAELAGLWELPGGKVEPGEDERTAVVRECREELGIDVIVGDRLGGDLATLSGLVIRVYVGQVRSGDPVAREHRALAWLSAPAVAGVPWLPSNTPLLAELHRLLGEQPVSADRRHPERTTTA